MTTLLVRCNNYDCVYCIGGECTEEEVEFISESPNYNDEHYEIKRASTGLLYCENFMEK